MSTTVTFERINSKVLIKKVVNPPLDSEKSETYLVDGTANVRTEDRLNGYIIITDKVDQSADNGILIKTADISGLTFTDADDLIEQLATNFFFRVGGVSTEETVVGYTAAEVDALLTALKTPSNFLEALTAFGTSIKALPLGTSIYSFMNGGTSTLVDGSVYYTAFYIPKAITCTGINFVLSTAGNYTADNYNGFGLFSVSGGTYTKITETATDGNIWKTSAYTLGAKPWPSPQTLQPGIYIVALQWNASATTTAPVLYSMSPISANHGLILTNSNKISSYQTSQTALPATTVSASALTVGTLINGIWMY